MILVVAVGGVFAKVFEVAVDGAVDGGSGDAVDAVDGAFDDALEYAVEVVGYALGDIVASTLHVHAKHPAPPAQIPHTPSLPREAPAPTQDPETAAAAMGGHARAAAATPAAGPKSGSRRAAATLRPKRSRSRLSAVAWAHACALSTAHGPSESCRAVQSARREYCS